jgi:hypothetical protein
MTKIYRIKLQFGVDVFNLINSQTLATKTPRNKKFNKESHNEFMDRTKAIIFLTFRKDNSYTRIWRRLAWCLSLCEVQPAFSSILQKWWDEHCKNKPIMLVLCGSALSRMHKRMPLNGMYPMSENIGIEQQKWMWLPLMKNEMFFW